MSLRLVKLKVMLLSAGKPDPEMWSQTPSRPDLESDQIEEVGLPEEAPPILRAILGALPHPLRLPVGSRGRAGKVPSVLPGSASAGEGSTATVPF